MPKIKKQFNNSSFGKMGGVDNNQIHSLIYCRVSSVGQKTEGHGLESQELRCRAFSNQNHYAYEKTFLDSYSGAGDFMNRPAMRELLAYIDKYPHKQYIVIFDDLKRFARDVEFHIKLRTAFKVRDVDLKCLNYNFDESPEGRFAELIMAGSAQLEREQNRRQVIQKQKARLEAGYWAFGAKKGYDMIKDPQHGMLSVPIQPLANNLKEALEGFASGLFPRMVDACKFLVEKKVWTKQSPEKYIDKFKEILRDIFYAGYIEYSKWEVSRRKGYHQEIISLDTYELNQKRLYKESLNKRIRIDISPEFPMRGLVSCAFCNEHLTAGWTRGRSAKYPYYVCHNKECEAYGKSIKREDIEKSFGNLLKKNYLKKEAGILTQKLFGECWEEEIKDLSVREKLKTKQRTEIENRIKEFTDELLKAKIEQSKDIFRNRIEEESIKLEELGNLVTLDLSIPYRTALEKAIGLLRSPYMYWQKLDVFEQQKFFFFIYNEKLPYDYKEGYRTNKTTCAVRMFEEFATSNTQDVDFGFNFWNQFARECEYLVHIMKEYEADRMK